jgi:hypothetical protein
MQAQTTQIGIVSPVIKGEWKSTVTYNKLNIVTHNGVSFIAYGTVTGIVEPGVTAGWESYWMKLSTSPVPMGEWNSTTTYPYLAIVTLDGSSYIAKEENYNKNPATSFSWQLIAEKGDDGGFSPTAKVEQTADGAVITITDKSGTTTATVTDGKDGKNGTNGTDGTDGTDGITPTIGANGNWYLGNADTGKPSRGANGANGTDGKSAYASAQDGGFTGTEAQFNKSLSVMGQVDGVEDTDALGIDTTVTQNSSNLITSGAVYSYGQSLDANGVPDYVVSEAKATIAKAMSHNITGESIRFIAVSDAHNDSNNKSTPSTLGPQIQESNKHCGQAVNYIANHIGIDFVAFLGDATWAGTQAATYTQSELNNDIEQTNEYLADGFKGLPQVRCVGNHDQYLTTDGTRLWNKGAYQLYGRYCSGIKNNPGGYGYFDLDNEQVRVIYINTSDAPSSTNAGTLVAMTDEQTNWLAETLLSTGDKTGWKILLLTHVPFDLISSNDILTAYANGSTYNTYNFADRNNAPILAQVNGHLHCYSYGYVNQAKVRRFTIPNCCYGDNNHYKGRPGYGNLADDITYPKTPASGKDTAFSLITIDLGNNTCYVDNYGAGIDREFSCDYNVPAPPATNQIPISTDTDGSIYNGTGYKLDTRLPTNGIPATAAGYLTTGFMPFTVGNTIYVNDFCLTASEQSNCKVAFYNADHTIIAATSAFGLTTKYGYTIGQPLTWTAPSTVYDTGSGTDKDISTAAYIRLSIGGYNDTADSIVCNIE